MAIDAIEHAFVGSTHRIERLMGIKRVVESAE